MGVEGFNWNNNLTLEANKSTSDGYVSKQEAAFMVKVIEKYGRKNIKINHNALIKLGKEFGLNDKHITKIGQSLERKLRERAKIHIKTKNKLKKLKNNLSMINYTKYFNYSLSHLSKYNPQFRGPKGKIEYYTLIGPKRTKMIYYINKYMSFLNQKDKERYLNTLFFESVYGTYTINKNRNGTKDIGVNMINTGLTTKELIKKGIIGKISDLYNIHKNFQAAAYILKKYGMNRWYGLKKAQKTMIA